MRIRMLRTAKGSPDGVNVYHYEAGQVLDSGSPVPLPISDALASLYVSEGWAEDATGASMPTPPAPPTPEPDPVEEPSPAPDPTQELAHVEEELAHVADEEDHRA